MNYYSKRTLFKFDEVFYMISSILFIMVIIIQIYNNIMNI